MKVPVVMPQLGLTMTEGSVNTWLMKIGDHVHKGDMLFVVSTDKADMEIESLDEGVLSEIVVELGNVVPVGTVIAYLSKPGDGHSAVSAPPVAASEPQPATPPEKAAASHFVEEPPVLATEPATQEAKVRVSPRARRLARSWALTYPKSLEVDEMDASWSGTSQGPKKPRLRQHL